jgi:hypothetical protein
LLLARIEGRLKSLEAMGVHGVLDETISGVYNTVSTIKDKCSGIGMIDEGWRKAEIVLGVLQDRYPPISIILIQDTMKLQEHPSLPN